MKVLGMSTSTPRGSVALVDGETVRGQVSYEGEARHAERLFEAIDALLQTAGVDKRSLDAIACDVGPGSFTGVRAGLAAAKGVALALQRPLVGVVALAAMAAAAWADPRSAQAARVACLVDAKRGETFFGVYDRSLAVRAGPGHVASEQAVEALGGGEDLLFAGEQAVVLGLEPARVLLDGGCRLPDASWIARLAQGPLRAGATPSIDAVEALYLRAPDAVPMAGRR